MTPEAQQIAIAKACGRCIFVGSGIRENRERTISEFCIKCGKPYGNHELQNYLNDLNAVRAAVFQLFPNRVEQGFYHPSWETLMDNLKIATGYTPRHWNDHALLMASAAQLSEAIVKTIGKWVEE